MEYRQRDLFLNLDDPDLEYRRRKDEEKSSSSWGQRKLLLTLLQFISLFWDPDKVPEPKVVYAGAAPGTNIGIVSSFFPEIEFHLYDPKPFKIKPSDRIHLYRQYFTDDDAKLWAGRSDIYFISDIRTADYTKAKDLDENERIIMKDMENQKRWYNIIKPVHGHLKFRLPYTGGNRPDKVTYLKGYVFKQVVTPQTSTETRLVPTGGEKEWDVKKYQNQMFHHNVVIRESYSYINPFTNTDEPIDSPELLNDWDSRTEIQILMDYMAKRSIVNRDNILLLSRLITSRLTEKSKYKDTLAILRSNPQFIKQRNMLKSRDDMDNFYKKDIGKNTLSTCIGLN